MVGSEVASTGLGIVACTGFLMAVLSPSITEALYETLGLAATIYHIEVLFVAAAQVFAVLVSDCRTTKHRMNDRG